MKLLALVSLTLSISTAYSQIDKIGWSPDVAIGLGKGITKSFPLNQHFNCFNMNNVIYKSIDNIGRGNSVNSEMKISIVTSKKDLDNILGISGKISAHATFSKVLEKWGMPAIELAGGYGKSNSIDETSLALVVSVEADYGRYEMKQANGDELELKETYKSLLEKQQYDEFIQKCGTHFVTQENRKARVTAIIKISDLSKEKKTQLAASLKLSKTLNPYRSAPPSQTNSGLNEGDPTNPAQNPASGQGPLFTMPYQQNSDPGIGLGIDNFLKSAKESSGSIEVTLTTRGGGGMAAQTQIFLQQGENGPTFKGLMETIAQYLASYKVNDEEDAQSSTETSGGQSFDEKDNAASKTKYNILPGAPSEYFLGSYEIYGLPKAKSKEIVNNDLLEEVYYLYIAALGSLNLIQTQLESVNPTIENQTFEKLSNAKINYEKYIRNLWDIAKSILDHDADNDPTHDSLPKKPVIKLNELMLSATISKAAFVCIPNGEISCGTKASNWTQSGMPLWKSQFEIEGNIGALHLLETLILRQVDARTGSTLAQLISLGPKDNLPYASIDGAGNFKLKFGLIDQIKGYAEYVKIRNTMSKFEIVLKAVDGTERSYPVRNVSLEGKHVQIQDLKK